MSLISSPPVTFFSPVQDLLDEVERLMQVQAYTFHPVLGEALRHLLSSGGKRIRPALVLLTGKMLGADEKCLISLAAAVEMLHTATLVHDDLIDGAMFRRGNETLNARWSPAATVLTGDFIFARAAQLAAETNSVEVMKQFSKTLSVIVNGEITQLFSSHGLVSRSDYEKRIYAKTASVFEVSTIAAGLLCPVEENVLSLLGQYGRQLGMAFQVVDDVLDFTGEQAMVGKPLASDLRQGLITLPTLIYMEICPEDKDLKAILDGQKLSPQAIERLITSIRESGAIGNAMSAAADYIDQAVVAIAGLPDQVEKRALSEMAYFIIKRQT